MAELQRTPISLSLFKPQVIVDAIEGCWFAVISDGTTRVEVTEWPLWDCQFLVDAHTVLHIELYTADDQGQFWRNECSKFSEVYVPAAKVIRGHGGVFRTWLGLQRGYFTDEACLPTPSERYEASISLANCLLSPKLCISVLSASAATLEHPSAAPALDGVTEEKRRGIECDAMLRESVVQHSTIITALNQQMYTLWLKGRIVSGDKSTDDDNFTAYLIDANVEDSSPFVGFCEYEKSGDADSAARLQEEVNRLTENVVTISARLDESERLKDRYRKRLTELTGEQFEEDDCVAFDEADFVSIQALQRETRHLQEKLQAERARSGAAQKDLEALRSGSAGKWTESMNDELKRRHSDKLRQLSRIHAVEVESFRAAEHEQRLLVQELQRKSDTLAQDALRKQAQVTILQDEIGELTARLAEACFKQDQSPNASVDGARITCEDPGRRRDIVERRAADLQCEVSNEGRLRQQDLSESARSEVESLRSVLKTRNLEQKEEVLELRANLQKEKELSKKQADSHVEALQQRDLQHGRQLAAIYAELALEKQARDEMERLMGESQQVEFYRCEQAARVVAKDRESRLRCELQDLEDANIAMSQQTQRQFDDFASLQERFNREILSFKEQHMHEDGSTSFSKLQQANRILQSEVKELRVELNAERTRQREPAEATIPRQASVKSLAVSNSGGSPVTPHVRLRPVEGVWGIEPSTKALSVQPSTSQRVVSGRQLVPAIGVVTRVGNTGERLAHR